MDEQTPDWTLYSNKGHSWDKNNTKQMCFLSAQTFQHQHIINKSHNALGFLCGIYSYVYPVHQWLLSGQQKYVLNEIIIAIQKYV